MVEVARSKFVGKGVLDGRAGLYSRGMPVFPNGIPASKGTVIHVDSGHTNASDNNEGTDPNRPMATISAGYAKCAANNGDIVLVSEGHAETTTLVFTLNKAGVSIIGLGNGNDRPAFTINGVVDGMDITAVDNLIQNIRFPTPTAAVTAVINIAAARAKVYGCWFECGANAVDVITITAAGARPHLAGNFVVVTANGPDNWVITEGIIDAPIIEDNVIIGSDGTNAWDDGAINYGSVAVTNPICRRNVFLGQGTATVSVVNNGSVTGEMTGPNAYAGLATSADNTAGDNEVLDQLSGASGIPTWPAAAAAANGVSIAEALRWLDDAVQGAAGVVTYPAAAVPGNGVSLAEVLRDVWDALRNGTGGTEPGANKSLADAIGFDGAAAIAASAGMLRTANGTRFVVKKTLTSSAVVGGGVDVTGVSSGGDILIEDFTLQANATGLAAGTNFTLECNNVSGSAVFASHAVASLGANTLVDMKGATTGKHVVLESTKKVIAKCTVADCTGAGTIDVYLLCRRLADNATLAAA